MPKGSKGPDSDMTLKRRTHCNDIAAESRAAVVLLKPRELSPSFTIFHQAQTTLHCALLGPVVGPARTGER